MWNVVWQVLSRASLTQPTSATAPFADSIVSWYGNVKWNLATNQAGDFTDVKQANLEAYVLGITSWVSMFTFNSAETDVTTSVTTRTISLLNTNTTTNNAVGMRFRSYGTDATTLWTWAKILAQFTGRAATTVTADLVFLTSAASVESEKMRITSAGAVVLPVSSPGLYLYNTADQTTNFERWTMAWESNVLIIKTQPWWSGNSRTIALVSSNSTGWSTASFSVRTQSAPFFQAGLATSRTTTGTWFDMISATSTASSSTVNFVTIAPTVNQSSTAAYTGLLVNPTEITTGSGANALIKAQVWWSARFFVWNTLATMVWYGTEAPTHTVTYASTTTGMAAYNTADQTTNYERGLISRSSNIFQISTERWWSWTQRELRLVGWISQSFRMWTAFPAFEFVVSSSSSSSNPLLRIQPTSTSSSGVFTSCGITPIINQSWTAWYTALLVNPTEWSLWSWAKNLILAQVWWVTKMSVDNNWWLLNARVVSANASTPVNITAPESNKVYTNEWASAKIVFNLPTAVAWYTYTFIVQDADGIDVTAAAGDTIRRNTNVTAPAWTVTSTAIGSVLVLVAINDTEWIATTEIGTRA